MLKQVIHALVIDRKRIHTLCKWRHTDEVANKKGVVIGPKSVVNSRVPSAISANNVVSCGDDGNKEEEKQGDNCC